jgi:hypothetical protein
VAFGAGLIILLFCLLFVTAKSADGSRANGIQLLRGAGVSTIVFVPLAMIIPALVVLAQRGADALGDNLMAEATQNFLDVIIAWVNRALGNLGWSVFGIAAAIFNPGSGLLILVTVLAALLFGLLLMIELTLAHFALPVVVCLMPMALGLSVFPGFRGTVSKLVATAMAIMFIKPAVWFAFWIGSTVVADYSVGAVDDTFLADSSLGLLLAYVMFLFTVVAVAPLAWKVLGPLLGSGIGEAWNRSSGLTRGAGTAARTVASMGVTAGVGAAASAVKGVKTAVGGARAAKAAKGAGGRPAPTPRPQPARGRQPAAAPPPWRGSPPGPSSGSGSGGRSAPAPRPAPQSSGRPSGGGGPAPRRAQPAPQPRLPGTGGSV